MIICQKYGNLHMGGDTFAGGMAIITESVNSLNEGVEKSVPLGAEIVAGASFHAANRDKPEVYALHRGGAA